MGFYMGVAALFWVWVKHVLTRLAEDAF